MEGLQGFLDKLQAAASAIRESGIREAVVLHHDEADGLTSAALAKLALSDLGLETRLICLDKLYPEVVEDIEAGRPRVVAYVDLGSGHIDWLIKANRARNLIQVFTTSTLNSTVFQARKTHLLQQLPISSARQLTQDCRATPT